MVTEAPVGVWVTVAECDWPSFAKIINESSSACLDVPESDDCGCSSLITDKSFVTLSDKWPHLSSL